MDEVRPDRAALHVRSNREGALTVPLGNETSEFCRFFFSRNCLALLGMLSPIRSNRERLA